MVAIGNHGIRLKRKRTPQQTVPDSGGKERQPFVAARAGEEQHAEVIGARVGRGKRGQLPRCAKGPATLASERQRVPSAWLQIGGVKLPELAARIVHPAPDRNGSNSERWRLGEWADERRLDQKASIADRRQKMPHLTAVPVEGSGRSALVRKKVGRQ